MGYSSFTVLRDSRLEDARRHAVFERTLTLTLKG